MIKKSFLVFLFITASFSVMPQDSDLGNWLIFFGDKKLSPKWNWHFEAQYRNYNAIGDLEQLLLRSGIGYNLTENNNNVLQGYAYIHSQNYIGNDGSKDKSDEHRLYQQFITRQHFGRFSILHRYRFEQRFFVDDFRLRLRYFIAINLPLNSAEMSDKTFYLSAYNEIFLNTEQNNVFDRNRLYGGIGYKLNNMIRWEAGYMNQFLSNGNRDQINLIAFLNF